MVDVMPSGHNVVVLLSLLMGVMHLWIVGVISCCFSVSNLLELRGDGVVAMGAFGASTLLSRPVHCRLCVALALETIPYSRLG